MSEQIKQFDGQARDPERQFQIGDRVLYLPEGVYSVIEGYLWIETVGRVPRIGAYRLSCGIAVPENSISKQREV